LSTLLLGGHIEQWVEKGYFKVLIFNISTMAKFFFSKLKIGNLRRLDGEEISPKE